VSYWNASVLTLGPRLAKQHLTKPSTPTLTLTPPPPPKTAPHTATTRQAKDWDSKLAALERQHLADKERWRREVAVRIKETKLQMAQLADQHLEGTTKRAIVENEAMVSELAYHSAQSVRLMAANAQLRGDTADLRRQAAIAQRTREYVGTIKWLHGDCGAIVLVAVVGCVAFPRFQQSIFPSFRQWRAWRARTPPCSASSKQFWPSSGRKAQRQLPWRL